MKRWGLVALAAAIAVLVVWVLRHESRPQATPSATPVAAPRPAAVVRSVDSDAAAVTRSTPSGARRLGLEDRAALAENIHAAIRAREAARRARAGSGAGSADPEDSDPADPTTAEPTIPLEAVSEEAQAALMGAVPILADCYRAAGSAARTAPVAQMVMTSDPDFGTVIDTSEMTDPDGKPLPPALDTCLRDAIDSLALPPLGVPGRLALQYTFRLDP